MGVSAGHRTVFVALAAVIAVAATGGIHFARASDPGAGAASSVVPVTPYRILDTRNGIGAAAAPVAGGQTIDVQIAGVGPVPTAAVGVVLNITGTRTTEATYITAWPTGATQPTASVLNLTPGIDAPNGVTALLGAGGKLSLFNFTGSTDLIADVAGYLVPAAGPGAPGDPAPTPAARPLATKTISATQVGSAQEVDRITPGEYVASPSMLAYSVNIRSNATASGRCAVWRGIELLTELEWGISVAPAPSVVANTKLELYVGVTQPAEYALLCSSSVVGATFYITPVIWGADA